MKYRIALVGNPNCGKTTLFNELTGSNQYVGNWPGVTVEQKSGHLKHHENDVDVIDLPGIYSFSVYSLEEVITRDYIENERPDVIINIVDASNLERNLFLTLQLAEMGCPMVIALNMMDIVEARGDKLDVEKLQNLLGIPIMPIVARKSEGTHELIHLALDNIGKPVSPLKIYSNRIESLLCELEQKMHCDVCSRTHAVRFIDEGIGAYAGHDFSEVKIAELNDLVERRIEPMKLDRDMIIADEKYKFITSVTSKILDRSNREMTMSDKIDRVVTDRVLAIPLFLVVMFAVFFVAFGPIGNFFTDGFNYLIETAINSLSNLMKVNGISEFLHSLVIDGILAGVSSVLSFLPQIAILFLCLSFLEDSGYMARTAFIMDRVMKRFGLSGRSFIPMLMGFGCTVPALMAARTLENKHERRLTMIITPFMSCSARIPVYALFAGTFFKGQEMVVIFSMYIIGTIVALTSGIILKKIVVKDKEANFIMELPEYRLPTLKNLCRHTWEKIRGFVVKAGTTLVIAFIAIWFLQNFSLSLQFVADSEDSIFSAIGRVITPIFIPLGFGNWQASSALLTGIVAKEAIVGTFGIVGGIELFTPISAISFLVFVLTYMPCIAAIATLKRESNSLKFTLSTLLYHFTTAWVVSFIVYQVGMLIF